jgi:hypothetical protein
MPIQHDADELGIDIADVPLGVRRAACQAQSESPHHQLVVTP